MKTKTLRVALVTGSTVAAILLALGNEAVAHKEPHDAATLKAFEDAFMEQAIMGDRLFHGEPDAEKKMNVQLSKTGMACAMCHPYASDVHPHEFPKFQEQMSKFATLRDMINWCIEKPNEGVKIDPDGAAMKALGTGHSRGVLWRDIEVVRHGGPPQLRFHGGAGRRLEMIGGRSALLTITHSNDLAMAQVLILGESPAAT